MHDSAFMDPGEAPPGLTEFTNSESRLERLLALAYMVSDGPKGIETLAKRAERELHLANREVFGRHLRLAERLHLVQREGTGGLVSATDLTRALQSLDRGSRPKDRILSRYDRIAFASALFKEADYQLMTLVSLIESQPKSHPAAIVVSYFDTTPDLPWPKEGVERNRRLFRESAKTPRLWEHKVSAMVAWLRSLGMVTPSGVYAVTPAGRAALLEWRRGVGEFRRRPLHVAAIATGTPLFDSKPGTSTDLLISEKVTNAIRGARAPLGMVSYEFVHVLSVLSIVVQDGIAVESGAFYEVVKRLWKSGVVRSIVMGREGRPVALTLG